MAKIKDAFFKKNPFIQFLSGVETVLSHNHMVGNKDITVRQNDVAKILPTATQWFHRTQSLLTVSGS